MATIGELIINLNANTASFVTDLNRVKNLSFDTATQVQRSFSLIGTAALGMIGTFAGAMVGMVDHTVELETHILHLASASGMSVEAMSGLAFVAKMFGMEVDSIASAMEKFDKQLIAAQLGNAKANQNMSLLGIDPASISTSDQALVQLSAHFAAMPDGILKTGEAMLAFSKNGAQMLEFLNQGPVAIQKYLDMARALGLVFDKDDAEAALHFKQNLEILHGSFTGFQIQLEKAILPNLTELTDLFVAWRMESVKTGTAVEDMKTLFQVLASTIIFVVEQIRLFGSDTQEIASEVQLGAMAIVNAWEAVSFALNGQFEKAHEKYQEAKDDIALYSQQVADGAARRLAIEVSTGQQLNAIWGEGAKNTEAQQKALDALNASVKDKAAKAFDALKKSVEGVITSLQTQIATFGMTAAQIEIYKIKTDAAKLGLDAWAQGEIALYTVLQNKLNLLQQLGVLDNSKKDEEKLLFLGDKLKADTDDLAALKAQADVVETIANAPQPLMLSPAANQVFTDSINEQTKALEYQIATFGMSSEAIARYNLAQLDSSSAAQAQIVKFGYLQDQMSGLDAHAKTLAASWKQFGDVALRSLTDLIFSGKSFTQVLQDITKQLGEMFLKWALFGQGDKSASGGGGIFGALFNALGLGGSGPTGGIPDSVFTAFPTLGAGIPTFAGGGAVSANVPIMVGENGPEIFRPGTAGAIIPNGGGGSGPQVNVVYQIDARGSSITEAQFQASLARSENSAVSRALNASREMQLRSA
jgi:hypothetical protein